MKISQAFPSKFLKADEVGNQRFTLVIADVKLEDVGDDAGQKPVAYFHGAQKGMVLNKTNAEMISHLYGDDTDAWRGKQIELFTMMTSFQGRNMLGLRVMAPSPAAGAHGNGPLPGSLPAGVSQGMPETRPVHPAPDPNAPSDFQQPSQHGPQGAGADLDDSIPFAPCIH